MRRLAGGITAALLAIGVIGAPGPVAASTTSDLKIVLVVGATNGTTPTYKAWMDDVYTTARKYSNNVIKVYSPNATWPAVKAAAQGANILVYMGHGNGFPSPYRSTLYGQSENGFGLNAAAGKGDDNVQYWGEYYVAQQIKLAPNALVILSHLCYASGNSEPGKTAPTASQAKQRMDNYSAGFIAAGARAVIADGHMDPQYYIDALFTTHKTVDRIFRDEPYAKGSVYGFDSVRTPGYAVIYDPEQDNPIAGYYRSMVSIPGLTADNVLGGATTPTDPSPADFVVPGAAEVVNPAGAGLFADVDLTPAGNSGAAPATLPAGTHLRLTADQTNTAGTRVLSVTTMDGATTGFVAAADLAPRDSTAPKISRFAVAPNILSPVISGSRASISAGATEPVSWSLKVTDAAGTVLASSVDSGSEILTSWDGRSAGQVVPDGTYKVTLTARDGWGNAPATVSGQATVDATKPELTNVGVAGGVPATFSPNGDGSGDTVVVRFQLSEAASVRVTVRDNAGRAVRDLTASDGSGRGSWTWNGRNSAGNVVPDGDYAIELVPTDSAGNRGDAASAPVRVYTALHRIAPTPPVFFPLDHDKLAQTIRLGFTLDDPATVGWRVMNAAGTVVRTFKDGEALAAGTYHVDWDGLNDAGTALPRGEYRVVVDATDGVAAARVVTAVTLDAFRVVTSTTTPARKSKITFTVTSAETLRSAPVLKVVEPGRGTWTWYMTRVSAGVYRATVQLKGSRTGTLVVTVVGTDKAGGTNTTKVRLPLH